MSDFRERASEPADISVPSPTPSVDVQSSPAVPAMAQSAEFSSFLGGSLIQRMGGSGQSADVSSTVGALASDSGGAMPHRERMESAFGQSFGGVSSHTGPKAQAACESMGAEAFAVGNHVAFRSSSPSVHTVAHEATHVVQQRGGASGIQTKLSLGPVGDASEVQADAVAADVVSGRSVETSRITPASSGIVRRQVADIPLPKKFDKMWEAHPHNYMADEKDNTSSDQVNQDQGWNPDQYGNTCAIRLSVMWNKLGGNYKLTRERGANAGLKADRMPYSKKTGFYYILSAKEMWLYMSANFGAPHQSWPKSGAFKDSADFQKNFDSTIKPVVSARKGVVAFDKIFGYSGTGHVDIFDGEKLSDSPSWYGCQRLKVWYISA
ncbi:MAG: DUF4157 domain-containing protein [Myxococcales bacterium]|nr:DUF4157 domain-containing protein [Myxococcales bacterium]